MQYVGNIFLVFALNELCRMGAENLNLSEIYRKLGPKCIIKGIENVLCLAKSVAV